MNCPTCSFDNPGGSRFCENCGQPLELVCPNCGEAVTPTAKFCRNCGFKLSETQLTARPAGVTRSEPLEALRRAAPRSVASKILSARKRMEGERKLVTALFTDIVGSTSLAEQMDPEEWGEIVSTAHRIVSQAVYRYEGTIAQLLGDGVLAFFGAPLAHEDDPERAIRAALEIREAMKNYADALNADGSVADFQMRLGINSGLVVVGQIGSDLHMEYLAVGDTVNMAARMQSAAEPNEIMITENTQRMVPNLFELEDRAQIQVKGRAEPVHAFRVLSERKGAVRSRGIEGLTSPLVGREREMDTLNRILEELRQGHGGILSIVGDGGLGKSRLVAEWRRKAGAANNDQGVRWVEGRCLSYGRSMAHHLSTAILLGLIGTGPEATEAECRLALHRQVEENLGRQFDDVYPYLGHLLGLELEPEQAQRVTYLDGAALQAKYIFATKALLRALATRAPLVIVCEDIQWADPSSAELGAHVLPIAAEVPLTVVLISRPDKESPGWGLVRSAREIAGVGALELHLAPLTQDDSQELIQNLLAVDELPPVIREAILSKAEGNPFFVEEVIRMLIDQEDLVRENGRWKASRALESLEIPDTLQAVLAARIDRLPEEAKHVLQIASVIGRKFDLSVLEAVLYQAGAEAHALTTTE
ncbi:MAG TPA: adenylate/guanylate cyclase domain-containing protein [Anaerolineales bacterium]|nr:adenylate/guanylate cyclase domain-containing protein [Anaerolineales bacterium]